MVKKKSIKDLSTEEKILAAADKIFTEKGYAAARTRDIAEEAGINLALLNYYFRSKEKLFFKIMTQKVEDLFVFMFPIISNDATSLDEKVAIFVDKYIEVVSRNPNLPLFLSSEMQKSNIIHQLPIDKVINNASLIRQIRERNSRVEPIHFFMNLLGLTIFPFFAKPVLQAFGVMDDNKFKKMNEERKKLIPVWIKTLLDQ